MIIYDFFKFLNSIIWGIPMIITLLGIHIYFTYKLGFVQKKIFKAIKYTGSSFGTLTTTLAATLGTGNIAGISAAIIIGGPGAVFWCWLTGVFGMATSYAECFLGLKYRIKENGNFRGGPMYVLEHGMKSKYLAVVFCISTLFATFGVGCTTQSGTISQVIKSCVGIPTVVIGFVISILVGIIIIGGINAIINVTNKLVPAMAIFYIIGCFIVLFINNIYIIDAIQLIIETAFRPSSVLGGLTGVGIIKAARYGVARGLFTNEAGLGSASIAASETKLDDIKKQSLISMSATFWDTVIMCAITGIVIVTSLLRLKDDNNLIVHADSDLTAMAFDLIPGVGRIFLGVSLILFAFATLVGWSFFGERAFEYLFGRKYINTYKIIYLVMVFTGTIISMNVIWEMCDFFNALMAIPNIISLVVLRKEIKS